MKQPHFSWPLWALGLGLSASALQAGPAAPSLGSIDIAKPAFLHIIKGPEAGQKQLLVSAFAVFGDSTVTSLTLNTTSLDELSSPQAKVLTSKLKWPNDITPIPEAIFGADYIALGSGFLTPGNNTGAVSAINLATQEVFPLAASKKDYFYHRVHFADINGDGRLDAVTARAKKPLIGASDGELIWLEQPANNPKQPWKEHLITKGPDTHFVLHDFEGDGQLEIISGEFFSKKLSLQWQEGGTWKSRVIDASVGSAFDLSLNDLNGDGKLDLLVSNHEADEAASIFAYEIPADYKTANWTRHTLLSGIKTEMEGRNQASPGTAFAIQPDLNNVLKKPWIIAAGDGSTKVHRLIPKSDSPLDWSYADDVLHDGDSTVGKIAIDDVNGDGRQELFVPAYHDDRIYIYQL